MSATPADAAGPVMTPGLGNRTVLVVDDDAAALKLAEAALQELRYEAVCLRDAEEALRAVALDPPAAIVLDLLMPNVDGFEFLSRLRATAAGRHVPIVVWTVKDLDAREYQQLQAATSAIILKGDGGIQSLSTALQRVLASATISPESTHGV